MKWPELPNFLKEKQMKWDAECLGSLSIEWAIMQYLRKLVIFVDIIHKFINITTSQNKNFYQYFVA